MSASEIERRVIPRATGEVRATGASNGRNGIAGTAAVIGSLSQDLGGFREEISANAFDRALKTSDIRALYNHSPNMILGRVKAGTAKVWADSRGLHYEITDMPKSRADVLEAIERGDVTGCSFSFRVAERGDSWTMRNGERIRTISEFAEILDVGPVCMPAYTATTVSARALELARNPATVGGSRPADHMAGQRRLQMLVEADVARDLREAERQVSAERRGRERQSREQRRARNIEILLRQADNDAEARWIEQVCVHEAAHAVFYLLDGAGVDAVWLDVSDAPYRLGGYARCNDTDSRTVQATLAGRAAEMIAGYSPRPFTDDPDIAKARQQLPSNQRSDADIEREIGKASDVLRKRWGAVQVLARELKLKTELDGDEVATIVARSLSAARAA